MKPLVLIPQYFGSLVFDRRNARYLPFDHECTRILLRGIQEEQFAGGCRARAQTLAGSAQAADPWHQEFLEGGGFAPALNWEV